MYGLRFLSLSISAKFKLTHYPPGSRLGGFFASIHPLLFKLADDLGRESIAN